ncbi:hypothetical protein QT231_01290 [Halomonas sp. SpR1]|uniref:hypothetical protein n=1 Tax=Halomonas sp. SpR1 TaxID=3050462 RepID=UPI0027E55AD8|nr:hypothetical protein [Halomonas sp. SpR1]MDQ7731312.1 hypothetical protein [Halomonas sp. SpR1]
MSEELKKCGIVMPISSIDGCDENHWSEVLSIIKDAVSHADFVGEIVSLSADVGVIHRRIVQNLYENPIVVCDVSGKNPNVMFELGLRLAFDKPTIIIKDDATNYSFDTSPIEHLEYPRSLRFSQIVEFKKELKNKIIATYKKSCEDPEYSPFLKHFGSFTVAKIDNAEVSPQEFFISQVEDIKSLILERNVADEIYSKSRSRGSISLRKQSEESLHKIFVKDSSLAELYTKNAMSLMSVEHAYVEPYADGFMVYLYFNPSLSASESKKILNELLEKVSNK